MICWKTIPFATALLVLQAGQPETADPLDVVKLQTFGLVVTAEPCFAVTQPSDVVPATPFDLFQARKDNRRVELVVSGEGVTASSR
jgi:hypothetical protein